MQYPQVCTLNAYQDAALRTLVCPEPDRLYYLSMQIAAEAGEVAGKIAKPLRAGEPINRGAVVKELGDVLWYVAVLASHLNVSLEDVANANLAKLADRAERGVIVGDGDNR